MRKYEMSKGEIRKGEIRKGETRKGKCENAKIRVCGLGKNVGFSPTFFVRVTGNNTTVSPPGGFSVDETSRLAYSFFLSFLFHL
jgi:hypothetical protein